MCTFCNKKNEKISLLLFFLVQYEKRKLACRTLYYMKPVRNESDVLIDVQYGL
jgi:hypothetical protein